MTTKVTPLPAHSPHSLRGHTSPSGQAMCRQRGLSPQIGQQVRFQRSHHHHPETGTVCSRQFGTGIIEVIDAGGATVELNETQYWGASATPHALPTHGEDAPASALFCDSAGANTPAQRGFPSGWWILPGLLIGWAVWTLALKLFL